MSYVHSSAALLGLFGNIYYGCGDGLAARLAGRCVAVCHSTTRCGTRVAVAQTRAPGAHSGCIVKWLWKSGHARWDHCQRLAHAERQTTRRRVAHECARAELFGKRVFIRLYVIDTIYYTHRRAITHEWHVSGNEPKTTYVSCVSSSVINRIGRFSYTK